MHFILYLYSSNCREDDRKKDGGKENGGRGYGGGEYAWRREENGGEKMAAGNI